MGFDCARGAAPDRYPQRLRLRPEWLQQFPLEALLPAAVRERIPPDPLA